MRTSIRFPYTSLLLAATAVATIWSPLLQQLFEYDRQSLAAGQAWRVITCHWTHFSYEHLFWDAAVFAVLGGLCEQRSRRSLWMATIGSAVLIPVGLWAMMPALETYRGLSGVDSALFTLVAVMLLRDCAAKRRWTHLGVTGGMLGAFAAKVAYELVLHQAVFVHTGEFVPIPLAHVVGACTGILAGLIACRPKLPPQEGANHAIGLAAIG